MLVTKPIWKHLYMNTMSEISFDLKKNHATRVGDVPYTIGVPFPEKYIYNGNLLGLRDSDGRKVPVQIQQLSLWPDNSIKWLLFDFITDSNEDRKLFVEVERGSERVNYENRLSIQQGKESISVNTGTCKFLIDKLFFMPFSSVTYKGGKVLDPQNSAIILVDSDENEYHPEVESIEIELAGALRSVIKVEGVFRNESRTFSRFISRLTFYANKSTVKIEFTLWNDGAARHENGFWDLGDPGSILFKSLSLRCKLNTQNATICKWKVHSRTEEFSTSDSQKLQIYQDSSGGENWQSLNHVNSKGEVPLSIKGYEVRAQDAVIDSGERADPCVCVGDGHRNIGVYMEKFWQNFPKSISCNDGVLELGIFPKEFSDLYELQGGERKTHTMYIDFGLEDEALSWCADAGYPVLNPEWVEQSRVFPYMTVSDNGRHEIFDELISGAIEGENSFFSRREIIDEFGWRNFGELYADHEAIGYQGNSPLISHYNNQYDFAYSAVRQFASTANPKWFELMNDLAHHIVDIDIYHTHKDRREYNGGLFWHTNHYLDAGTCTHRSHSLAHADEPNTPFCGGGPAFEHLYTSGLLAHHYLTGHMASRECVLSLADWATSKMTSQMTAAESLQGLIRALPVWQKVFMGRRVLIKRQPFTRETGNIVSTLLDAFELTRNRSYLDQAEAVIQGVVHPLDDILERDLGNIELNWSYTACLQSLGRYLDVKCQLLEHDSFYAYGVDSLLHYAKWMLDHERPYLENKKVLEYPNETWSAQDLRKACVFLFAARFCDDEAHRHAFIERADFFHHHAMAELEGSGTRDLARPVVLTLQNGYMKYWYEKYPMDKAARRVAKNDYRRDRLYLTRWEGARILVSSLWAVIKGFSFKKEVNWIKCRIYKHV